MKTLFKHEKKIDRDFEKINKKATQEVIKRKALEKEVTKLNKIVKELS